jgi:hypothetical protein
MFGTEWRDSAILGCILTLQLMFLNWLLRGLRRKRPG